MAVTTSVLIVLLLAPPTRWLVRGELFPGLVGGGPGRAGRWIPLDKARRKGCEAPQEGGLEREKWVPASSLMRASTDLALIAALGLPSISAAGPIGHRPKQ